MGLIDGKAKKKRSSFGWATTGVIGGSLVEGGREEAKEERAQIR